MIIFFKYTKMRFAFQFKIWDKERDLNLPLESMTHSYRSHYFHLVWAIKNCRDWIFQEMQSRLYAYIGGVLKNNNGTLISIGGTSNHVHLLISLSTLDNFSSIIRDVKAKSSIWVHKNYPTHSHFAWQKGYASFSVSNSGVDKVKNYIENQEQHHKTITFEEEYRKILMKHRIKFDDRFVLG